LEDGGQVLREIRFMSREEMEKLEILYPEWLKTELWDVISKEIKGYNTFKIRDG